MTSALIIVFREMLEMALVLGVLFAATRGMVSSRRWIGAGVGAGIVGALLFALFMEEIESSMNGDGEFLFNAVVLGLASVLIAWTVVWMSRHGREMSEKMKRVGKSVVEGDAPRMALAVVAAAAVLREGGEAVFFLFGAAQSAQSEGAGMVAGAAMGLLLGVATAYLIYRGLVRIPLRQMFAVIGWLLIVLAAGMASQSVEFLVMVDVLPPLVDPLWDASAWLPQSGIVGEVLHVMTGYSDQPSGMQVLTFGAALVVMSLIHHHLNTTYHSRSGHDNSHATA